MVASLSWNNRKRDRPPSTCYHLIEVVPGGKGQRMDAFESVVGEILWREGYWVQASLKVELTKEEKITIGRPSAPRWELDLVGYSGQRNELLVIECKSYLDSFGVQFRAFNGGDEKLAKRFKLFNDHTLRKVVLNRLCQQLADAGLITNDPKITLALVCGKIVRNADRQQLREHFDQNGWLLWDEEWLKQKLQAMSTGSYENSPVAVVAKLLLRGELR